MSKNDRSLTALPEKIRQYYSRNGIVDLVRESVPFLIRRIVDSQTVTADEIVRRSDSHQFWQESNEKSFSISEANHQRLRRAFEPYQNEFSPRPGTVYEIEDCDLVGPHATGLYKGKELICETSGFRTGEQFLGSRGKITTHVGKSSVKIRPNRSAEIVFPLICPDPSYYHWMMEYLPKLRLLELYREQTGNEPTLLVESDPRDFVCQTLRAAGYDSTQYEEWDQQDTRVEKLIVATHRPQIFISDAPELSNYNPSTEDFRWLRDRMRSTVSDLDSNSETHDRVYISRKEASRGRKVINREQLHDVLERHGFKSYRLEALSFTTQLEIFADADLIMGPHGAGLLNMIFAKDPTIVELYPESEMWPFFYNLADMFGFEYRSIVTESEGNNLIIDVNKLNKMLANIE